MEGVLNELLVVNFTKSLQISKKKEKKTDDFQSVMCFSISEGGDGGENGKMKVSGRRRNLHDQLFIVSIKWQIEQLSF